MFNSINPTFQPMMRPQQYGNQMQMGNNPQLQMSGIGNPQMQGMMPQSQQQPQLQAQGGFGGMNFMNSLNPTNIQALIQKLMASQNQGGGNNMMGNVGNSMIGSFGG